MPAAAEGYVVQVVDGDGKSLFQLEGLGPRVSVQTLRSLCAAECREIPAICQEFWCLTRKVDPDNIDETQETLGPLGEAVTIEQAYYMGRNTNLKLTLMLTKSFMAVDALLSHPSSDIRANGVQALGQLTAQDYAYAQPLIFGAFKDYEAVVRRAAADVLVHMANALAEGGNAGQLDAFVKECTSLLAKRVGDCDEFVQEAAVDSLVMIARGDGATGIELLRAQLEHWSGNVRLSAVRALVHIAPIGSVEAAKLLVLRVKDSDTMVRREAARRLGLRKDPVALPFLAKLCAEKQPLLDEVRILGLETLPHLIGERKPKTYVYREPPPIIIHTGGKATTKAAAKVGTKAAAKVGTKAAAKGPAQKSKYEKKIAFLEVAEGTEEMDDDRRQAIAATLFCMENAAWEVRQAAARTLAFVAPPGHHASLKVCCGKLGRSWRPPPEPMSREAAEPVPEGSDSDDSSDDDDMLLTVGKESPVNPDGDESSGVRKACAETLGVLASNDDQVVRDILLHHFSEDEADEVRRGCFSSLMLRFAVPDDPFLVGKFVELCTSHDSAEVRLLSISALGNTVSEGENEPEYFPTSSKEAELAKANKWKDLYEERFCQILARLDELLRKEKSTKVVKTFRNMEVTLRYLESVPRYVEACRTIKQFELEDLLASAAAHQAKVDEAAAFHAKAIKRVDKRDRLAVLEALQSDPGYFATVDKIKLTRVWLERGHPLPLDMPSMEDMPTMAASAPLSPAAREQPALAEDDTAPDLPGSPNSPKIVGEVVDAYTRFEASSDDENDGAGGPQLRPKGPVTALMCLAKSMSEYNLSIRLAALELLGRLGGARGRQDVISAVQWLLGDTRAEMRAAACKSLAAVMNAQDGALVQAIRNRIQDRDGSVRAAAIAALESLGILP